MTIPRRVALVALGVAVGTSDWDDATPAAHIDIGTAVGIGTLLSVGRFTYEGHPGVAGLVLQCPSDSPPATHMRGVVEAGSTPPASAADLRLPRVSQRLGVDVHPIPLDSQEEVRWSQASQMLVSRREYDAALACLRACPPDHVLGADGVAGLAELEAGLPPGQPLIVTDTIVSVYFRPEKRRELWEVLDGIAARRRLVWVSFNQPTPMGPRAKELTTGDPIPGRHEQRLSKAYLTVWRWSEAGERAPTLVLGHAEAVGSLHFTWLPQ